MQVSGGSMSKVRVYEVAKQLNLDPKQVVLLFQQIGISDVRNHMSSVEPEAVERVKRHLEKQKTHDVVEERIRPTVVKRRAVVKPGGAEGPASGTMQAAPSSVSNVDVAPSVRNLAAHSVSALDANVPTDDVMTMTRPDRESSARLPVPPPERIHESVRDLRAHAAQES